jgi:16S rRNA (cytosine1402-N4)-methyltransferase
VLININSNHNTHIPVLIDPILNIIRSHIIKLKLTTNNSKIRVFDGTLGGGGYTKAIYDLDPDLVEIHSCDLDIKALDRVVTGFSIAYSVDTLNSNKKNTFASFNNHTINLYHANFADCITSFEDNFFDFIIADLGFSNNQMRLDHKGFSYQNPDELLDLRYDQEQGIPASQFLNKTNTKEIARVLFDHSGEQFSNKIALKISDHLLTAPISTVGDLVLCVKQAIPQKFSNKTNSTLARVWQSLRIHINDEFGSLERFLAASVSKLRPSGSLMVVNFHSLEDKRTTSFMRQLSLPTFEDEYGNKKFDYTLETKKPIVPDSKELENNPQSRSATLRILTKSND